MKRSATVIRINKEFSSEHMSRVVTEQKRVNVVCRMENSTVKMRGLDWLIGWKVLGMVRDGLCKQGAYNGNSWKWFR